MKNPFVPVGPFGYDVCVCKDEIYGDPLFPPASPEGLTWFQNTRFGMFVHWSLYSLLGRGEWVMHNENNSLSEYEALAMQFNPLHFQQPSQDEKT